MMKWFLPSIQTSKFIRLDIRGFLQQRCKLSCHVCFSKYELWKYALWNLISSTPVDIYLVIICVYFVTYCHLQPVNSQSTQLLPSIPYYHNTFFIPILVITLTTLQV
jgi:hypothetical protein